MKAVSIDCMESQCLLVKSNSEVQLLYEEREGRVLAGDGGYS